MINYNNNTGRSLCSIMKKFFSNNPFNSRKNGEQTMTDDTENTENTDNIEEKDLKEEAENPAEESESGAAETSELEQLQIKYDELNNKYLRLAADFDNFRKRQMQEREALVSFGAQECLKKIIEVSDNFDRALETIEKIDNIDKMKENFYVLNKQLTESLSKMGLERIKCAGEKFDPNLHEAVMQVQTDEYPEDTIINELQKGYIYKDRVLRPAMVSAAVKKQ